MAPRTANAPPTQGAIVPAQLGFLAIFNPSLGHTDETIDDQIVYYASVTTQSAAQKQKRRRTRGRPTQDISQDERNERLRQIGLAQGMASFSQGFAGGAALETIDTEKSRVVLHELEPGWWILASIDLNKVPLPPRLPTKNGEPSEDRYEYSSREMKPANLLMTDLLRAHSIFLMHHDSSLAALFVRTKRSKFVTLLSRYWDLFLSTWNVMLHGNPTRDLFGGINISASGELGVGVGEEDRGSGEREVLEGLVGRTEGLVDLVVSKFGDYDLEGPSESDPNIDSWLGTGLEPGPADGAIFLGLGALSRKSLRDVTRWMEDLYTWGDHAYGVIDSPTSTRRAKKRRHSKIPDKKSDAQSPPSKPSKPRTEEATPKTAEEQHPTGDTQGAQQLQQTTETEEGNINKMVGYLKLGYGTYWSLPGSSGDSPKDSPKPLSPDSTPKPMNESQKQNRPIIPRKQSYDAMAHYLIGLKGPIEEEYAGPDASQASDSDAEHNSRTLLRTVHIELESEAADRPEATIVHDLTNPASMLTQSPVVGNMLPGYDSHDLNKTKKLRVVVYVNRPFIFTFLFLLHTDSLAWESLYRSLHYQLAPLRKPLLQSTKYRPERPNSDTSRANSIYDLIWDPRLLTVHSSIPNIPENYLSASPWSVADALNTHLHLLTIYAAARSDPSALERTQKTSRGWWIVWTRLLDQQRTNSTPGNLSTIHETSSDAGSHHSDEAPPPQTVNKEIFLIRRASDHVGFRAETGPEGAGKLAQGIGVDTRRYVEELLSLL